MERLAPGPQAYAREDWLIIVSTDHGGKDKGHGQDIPECRTIFLIVSGKSAVRGAIEPADHHGYHTNRPDAHGNRH